MAHKIYGQQVTSIQAVWLNTGLSFVEWGQQWALALNFILND